MAKTPEGREKSSMNALKHGLTSNSMFVLSNETQADWESLLQIWIDTLQPENEAERLIVEDIAHAQWRLRRARTWETKIFNEEMAQHDGDDGQAFKSLADNSRALDAL